MKRAAIYARVSTQSQSNDSQLSALRDYCKQRGWELVEEFVDKGVSGSLSKRPALDRLMDAARKRKFDSVAVYRFDRFARSTTHLVSAMNEFRSLGIGFVSYSESIDTSSPLGEAIFTICAAMAQLERDIIRERVRNGLAAAKKHGRIGGRPKTRDDEAIAALRKKGLSMQAIAVKLGISKGSVQASLKAKEK